MHSDLTITLIRELNTMGTPGFEAIIEVSAEGPVLQAGLGSLLSGSVTIEHLFDKREAYNAASFYKVMAWSTTIEAVEAELKEILASDSGEYLANLLRAQNHSHYYGQ